MSDLAQRTCRPCAKGTPPLPPARVQQLLGQLAGWELLNGTAIRKQLQLADFMSAVRLVNRIAEIAEADDHHPDLHITGYRRLAIELSTHAIGGLSENDFIVAAKIDALTAGASAPVRATEELG